MGLLSMRSEQKEVNSKCRGQGQKWGGQVSSVEVSDFRASENLKWNEDKTKLLPSGEWWGWRSREEACHCADAALPRAAGSGLRADASPCDPRIVLLAYSLYIRFQCTGTDETPDCRWAHCQRILESSGGGEEKPQKCHKNHRKVRFLYTKRWAKLERKMSNRKKRNSWENAYREGVSFSSQTQVRFKCALKSGRCFPKLVLIK